VSLLDPKFAKEPAAQLCELRVRDTSAAQRAAAADRRNNFNRRAFADHRSRSKEQNMPRGDKSSYTEKQRRRAEHIEEGYEKRGISHDEAERRAWATVNKESGGGKKSGSGRGRRPNRAPSRKGGRLGGRAAASRPKAERSASARKAARTRERHAAH
jgi:hypothetical protein